MTSISAPISVGELFDKITILELKREFVEETKRNNVEKELNLLLKIVDQLDLLIKKSLYNQLKDINKKLWLIEDEIRIKEKNNLFDEEFIMLARSVYKNNDERSRIKREINILFNSNIFEEKSYK